MPFVVALLAACLAVQAAGLPDQLVLSFTATDKKGKPVEDLKVEEIQVVENGTAHAIVKLELDRRPLTVALVIDSGALAGDTYRADLVPAAMNFVKRLPPGSTFSVWITSDRPKQLVPDGTDAKAAEEALRGIAPYGSNAAVDTIVSASQDLAKVEGRRTAIVTVTSANMGEVTVDVGAELAKVSLRPMFMSVEVIAGNQDARLEDALKALSLAPAGSTSVCSRPWRSRRRCVGCRTCSRASTAPAIRLLRTPARRRSKSGRRARTSGSSCRSGSARPGRSGLRDHCSSLARMSGGIGTDLPSS
jgi:hypothetical protein